MTGMLLLNYFSRGNSDLNAHTVAPRSLRDRGCGAE
jgi:hypothetical protein